MLVAFLLSLLSVDFAGPVNTSASTRPRGAACVVSILGGSFPTADWTPAQNAGAGVPTVTADAAAGPPGSCNAGAVKLELQATSGTQYSTIRNFSTSSPNFLCPATSGAKSYGCWVKGDAATDFDFCHVDSVGFSCGTVSATTSWVFFKRENVDWPADCSANGCQFMVGNASLVNVGGVARDAQTVYLDNCRCVEGATISP